MSPFLLALAVLTQAAPRDPEIYWTRYIYPETLEGEARARASDADIVKRAGLDLAILYDGKVIKHLVSDDRPAPSNIWLYAGRIKVGAEVMAAVRLETGKGGRQAIVKPDGTLFWTEGPASASPDGRWIAASGDWFDQMDDSVQNNYLRVFRWSDHRQYVFHKSCIGQEWIDATHFTAACNDGSDDTYTGAFVKGRWILTWTEKGHRHVIRARTN